MKLLALLLLGLSPLAVIAAARAYDAADWRRSLTAWRLRLPAGLTVDDVAAWLATVAAIGHPTRLSLLHRHPVALEVVASSRGIEHYLLLTEATQAAVLPSLRAALPAVRVESAPEYLTARRSPQTAGELILTNRRRALATERAGDLSSALLAAIQPLPTGAVVRLQWLLTSAGTPAPIPTKPATTRSDLLGGVVLGDQLVDSEEVRAARLKQRLPLLSACGRLGVEAPSVAQARRLFGRVWGPFHLLNAPGVRLRRRWLPSAVVSQRLVRRALPVVAWPLLLNSLEAAGAVALAAGDKHLLGLPVGAARTLPPPPSLPQRGAVIGVSNYPGFPTRPLALAERDRARALWIVGPTGAGKSWLLANLALQDIARGASVILVDTKNDTVDEVLARLDERRLNDVVVIDPADTEQPVGFTLLNARTEAGRELAVDHALHVFAELWQSSWGVRTADVLRNACIALTHSRAADGSAFTLVELPDLLLNPAFRRTVLSRASIPASGRAFWHQFEQLSDAERAQWIGPSLNKLRQLTTRTPLRLTLGQSDGLDLADVLRKPTVLLVKLSKHAVGAGTAELLGALLIASLWQAVLGRLSLPPPRRRMVYVYLDEFAELVRLPLSFADMLSQARGMNVGFTLANQFAAQLPDATRQAVLSTVRSHVTFQVDHDDARLLAPRFAPLTADDLRGLAAYEIALRPCVDGQTLAPVTGFTQPLGPVLRDPASLARGSRERYGRSRADVEAALAARLAVEGPDIGRRRRS